MEDEPSKPGWGDALQVAIIWLIGAVAIPVGLVVAVVLSKDVTLHSAAAGGEFFAIGASTAGASLALEMVLGSDRLTITTYKSALLLVVLANGFMFMGTVSVEDGEVLRNLEPQKIAWSIWLVGLAAFLGAFAPIRKVFADASLR